MLIFSIALLLFHTTNCIPIAKLLTAGSVFNYVKNLGLNNLSKPSNPDPKSVSCKVTNPSPSDPSTSARSHLQSSTCEVVRDTLDLLKSPSTADTFPKTHAKFLQGLLSTFYGKFGNELREGKDKLDTYLLLSLFVTKKISAFDLLKKLSRDNKIKYESYGKLLNGIVSAEDAKDLDSVVTSIGKESSSKDKGKGKENGGEKDINALMKKIGDTMVLLDKVDKSERKKKSFFGSIMGSSKKKSEPFSGLLSTGDKEKSSKDRKKEEKEKENKNDGSFLGKILHRKETHKDVEKKKEKSSIGDLIISSAGKAVLNELSGKSDKKSLIGGLLKKVPKLL